MFITLCVCWDITLLIITFWLSLLTFHIHNFQNICNAIYNILHELYTLIALCGIGIFQIFRILSLVPGKFANAQWQWTLKNMRKLTKKKTKKPWDLLPYTNQNHVHIFLGIHCLPHSTSQNLSTSLHIFYALLLFNTSQIYPHPLGLLQGHCQWSHQGESWYQYTYLMSFPGNWEHFRNKAFLGTYCL